MFGREKNKQGQPGAGQDSGRKAEAAPERPEAAKGECCGGCGCGDAAPGEPGAESALPADPTAMQIAQLKQQIEELNTRYLRTVADYQNVARRSVKDADEARYQGTKSVV